MAPRRAYLPAFLQGAGRAWGLALQLYALKSERNWGIGDFGDLSAMVECLAPMGVDAIGLNPLHALFPDQPERASPYSPSSRQFLNPLYLDVERIEDFAESEAARLMHLPEFQSVRARARAAPLVDYRLVADLKRRMLELVYGSFRERQLAVPQSSRARAFRDYQGAQGPALRQFATFQALHERHATADPARPSWRSWPEPYRRPGSPAGGAFVENHLDRVEFFEYLQWQADLQLARCMERALALDMRIGLYGDLAVGIDPDGADAWALQDLLVEGWSIGAPPDAWNPRGQDWGLRPFHPARLRACAYRPFIAVLRANMLRSGALRIDHILGLRRLFWIPSGSGPAAGGYVRYNWRELMSIVALESVRNQCIIVGEDLGTVPPGFSDTLQRHGILSYRLLYFTREHDGSFLPPDRWPREALAAVSTHDLPPFAGYWSGRDIELRQSLSLYPSAEQAERERIDREAARRQLIAALEAESLPPIDAKPPIEQVHRYVARTPCRLVMAQLEDSLGLTEPVNVPATVDAHPNWRRKIPRPIERLFEDHSVIRHLAAVSEERPRPIRAAPMEAATS